MQEVTGAKKTRKRMQKEEYHSQSMAKSKNNAKKLSCISVHSQIINSISASSLQSLVDETPKKSVRASNFISIFIKLRNPKRPLFFCTLFLFALFGMLKFGFNLPTHVPQPFKGVQSQMGRIQNLNLRLIHHKKMIFLKSYSLPFIANIQLQAKGQSGVVKKDQESGEGVEKGEFWKQPDGLGYRPCLDFSRDYRRGSEGVVKNRRKYLMVVVVFGRNPFFFFSRLNFLHSFP